MADALGLRVIKSHPVSITVRTNRMRPLMDILQCIYGFKWRWGVFSVKIEGPLMIEARQFQAQ